MAEPKKDRNRSGSTNANEPTLDSLSGESSASHASKEPADILEYKNKIAANSIADFVRALVPPNSVMALRELLVRAGYPLTSTSQFPSLLSTSGAYCSTATIDVITVDEANDRLLVTLSSLQDPAEEFELSIDLDASAVRKVDTEADWEVVNAVKDHVLSPENLVIPRAPAVPVLHEPPRRAEALLDCLLRPEDSDPLLGDLQQKFQLEKIPKYGLRGARWWYRCQVACEVFRASETRLRLWLGLPAIATLISYLFNRSD